MKRTPHFISISTRLGLTRPPVGKSEPNIGVEDAPPLILTPSFLAEYAGARNTQFTFSKPEDVSADRIWSVTAEESKKCIELIKREYVAAETQVGIGGDHSLSFCTILALLEFHSPETFAYIQIDTHADINRLSQSPSGNWHGMYLRPILFEDFEIPEITSLVSTRIPVENLMYFGSMELDGDEPELFATNRIPSFSVSDMRQNPQNAMQQVESLLRGKSHLHINIDIDAFDESIAPATGLPKKDGFLMPDLKPLFERIRTLPSISVDLVEVNPKKPGAERTISTAQHLIRTLLDVV